MTATSKAGNATEPLLDVQGLTVTVPSRKGPAVVVDDVSFELRKGEALGVVGESGCGKSITAMSLVGLLPPGAAVTGGAVRFEGQDLVGMSARALRRVRGGKISFVFQDPMTSLNPVMNIGRQLCEAMLEHRGISKVQAWKRGTDLLRMVGIPSPEERMKAFPHELSGGMRQRVMIAIGLACEPPLIIADEPTTALDVTIQAQIVDLVKDLRQRLGISVIWITHDLALVSGLVDRVIVLYAGKVIEEAPVDALYEHPTHPYTRGLLNSLPKLNDQGARRLASIPGTPPDPQNRPAGCPFFSRCNQRIARCAEEMPPLDPVTGSLDGHRAACWVTVEQVEAAA
ncbi:ABC transporter ATP-binding protein [Consotaella aegiceratis]|uniref:ABC transporter ATP-binding protein n=1 Tax=Consotaella aegiceratis TaxID=3097961 RepID=UPI002F3FD9B8